MILRGVKGNRKQKEKATQTRGPTPSRAGYSERALWKRAIVQTHVTRGGRNFRGSVGQRERSINSYAPNQQFRRRRGSSVPSSRVVIVRALLHIRPPQDRSGKARRRSVRCRWIIVGTTSVLILSTFFSFSLSFPRNCPNQVHQLEIRSRRRHRRRAGEKKQDGTFPVDSRSSLSTLFE